jgi:protein gp37
MFPCDLSDLFHPQVTEELIHTALDIFTVRDDADWVLLTKRPELMLEETNRWLEFRELEQLPDNIWCLVTAENQARLDERAAVLLQVKAQVLGLSLEPMLGPIDLSSFLICEWYAGPMVEPRVGTIGGKAMPAARLRPALSWVICGAEKRL